MLNKELLMVGSESLEPVLSIYISPDISYFPNVSCMLTTGNRFYASNTGETTLKFSEIELAGSILVDYPEGTQLSTTNLMSEATAYSGGVAAYGGGDELPPALIFASFRIRDRTQSASISLA